MAIATAQTNKVLERDKQYVLDVMRRKKALWVTAESLVDNDDFSAPGLVEVLAALHSLHRDGKVDLDKDAPGPRRWAVKNGAL